MQVKQGLLLVDIQNDYFPGGKYELYGSEKAGGQAQKILNYFREKEWPVFHVCHINLMENPLFFKPDTEGADFFQGVYPEENEKIIVKHKPDSFFETPLKKLLDEEGVEQLVICGMMTHMCIDTTVRTACKYGYPVTLIGDACATRKLVWENKAISAKEVQGAFLAALASGFATVINADEWLKGQS